MIEPSLAALKLLIWLSARQGVKGFLFIPLCIRASCTLLSKKHDEKGSSAYRFISQKSAEGTEFYLYFCLFFECTEKVMCLCSIHAGYRYSFKSPQAVAHNKKEGKESNLKAFMPKKYTLSRK